MELENTTHENGNGDTQGGLNRLLGQNGISIARDIRAFASAPPNIICNWKNIYIKPIIIGIKTRYIVCKPKP